MMDGVRIKSEGGISNGTMVTSADGEEIKGITGISIDLRVNDLVRAKIDLCAVLVDCTAQAEFRIAHPKTGDIKAVRRIEFADGEVIDL
jgi:hypothetical protein